MASTLVIVDSKAKYKAFMGGVDDHTVVYPDFKRIKKLANFDFRYNIDDHSRPQFFIPPEHDEIITDLKVLVAAYNLVAIVTDQDTRGEAFAEYISTIIAHPKTVRVIVTEYSKKEIKQALKKPVRINTDRVDSWLAASAINQLVWEKTYPLLQKHQIKHATVSLKDILVLNLICDREDVIELHKPEKIYSLRVQFNSSGEKNFHSYLYKINNKPAEITDPHYGRGLVQDLKNQQLSIYKKSIHNHELKPVQPFNTLTLVQEAARLYNIPPWKTLKIAKKLFEGVKTGAQGSMGLITYYRTNAVFINMKMLSEIRALIYEDYGADYLPKTCKSPDDTAGEAIRPVNIKLRPAKIKRYLTLDQFRIYDLIWRRSVASLMKKALFTETVVDIMSQSESVYHFRSRETRITFRGFMQVYDHDIIPDKQNCPLPAELPEKHPVSIIDYELIKKVTLPVERYTIPSLVEELIKQTQGLRLDLENSLGTLFAINFIQVRKVNLLPTAAGAQYCHFLIQNFPNFYNPGFIFRVENDVEAIKQGRKNFAGVILEFIKLQGDIHSNHFNSTNDPSFENTICPLCGGKIISVSGKNGAEFLCEHFPDTCRYKYNSNRKTAFISDTCDQCGALMLERKGPYGRFLACSQYPKCAFTKPFPLNVKCPSEGCEGMIVERMTRDGRLFFGCDRYPECKFASWNKPANVPCQNCGHLFMYMRKTEMNKEFYQCPECNSLYNTNLLHLINLENKAI